MSSGSNPFDIPSSSKPPLNAGSSSIKFAVFEAGDPPLERLRGQVEGIGTAPRLKAGEVVELQAPGTHDDALKAILGLIETRFQGQEVPVVGHRIVHGGPDFAQPVRLDPSEMAKLEALSPFAPLHQPHNLAGVRAAEAAFPQAIQVGCFDTAFHRTQSWEADTFALPAEYFERGIRRYGFHGLSYDFVAGEVARRFPELGKGKLVIAHLGNGASICAVSEGRSVSSTMGFTALDGLPMGTRSGQIDPGVLLYLMEQEGMDAAEISRLLYNRSGLLALSGVSNDMREIEAAGTERARNAVLYFAHRIRREVAALAADMGGIDALIFTAGIGEHSPTVRAAVCEELDWLGIAAVDPERNASHARTISPDGSRVPVLIVPTNEEMTIARAASGFA